MADSLVLSVELENFTVDETNELIDELYENFRRDTPIDTGYCRSRWMIEKRPRKLGQTGVISNDAPYIGYLEAGHSQQAPNGFIRRNIVKSLNRRK